MIIFQVTDNYIEQFYSIAGNQQEYSVKTPFQLILLMEIIFISIYSAGVELKCYDISILLLQYIKSMDNLIIYWRFNLLDMCISTTSKFWVMFLKWILLLYALPYFSPTCLTKANCFLIKYCMVSVPKCAGVCKGFSWSESDYYLTEQTWHLPRKSTNCTTW